MSWRLTPSFSTGNTHYFIIPLQESPGDTIDKNTDQWRLQYREHQPIFTPQVRNQNRRLQWLSIPNNSQLPGYLAFHLHVMSHEMKSELTPFLERRKQWTSDAKPPTPSPQFSQHGSKTTWCLSSTITSGTRGQKGKETSVNMWLRAEVLSGKELWDGSFRQAI